MKNKPKIAYFMLFIYNNCMEDLRKKITNIWFYYKVPIIVGIIVLFVSIYSIRIFMSKDEYDHSVAFISTAFPTEQQMDDIKVAFENQYGGTFEIQIFNIKLGADNQDQVTISQLDLDLGQKISEYLLIEDLDAFKKATNNLEIKDVALVSEIDWLKGNGIDNLYYAKR